MHHLQDDDDEEQGWSPMKMLQSTDPKYKFKRNIFIASVVLLILILIIVLVAAPSGGNNDRMQIISTPEIKVLRNLESAMSIGNIMGYLENLEDIANQNGNTRSVGKGFDESQDSFKAKLEEYSDVFEIEVQYFKVNSSVLLETPVLSQGDLNYDYKTMFREMQGSGSNTVSGKPFFVPNYGCVANDFTGYEKDTIAIIKRGNCTFGEKVDFAVSQGSLGVIIFNEGNTIERFGVVSGTLGGQKSIPVIGTAFFLGKSFDKEQDITMEISLDISIVETSNLLAKTKIGNTDSKIIVGSHLDSVPAGPGINDNGSGSAVNLELALNLAKLIKNENFIKIKNQIIFAWWGDEENGLLGSTHYVNSLNKTNGDLNKIALNLNYDMLASPNFVRGIYNGTSGPVNVAKASSKLATEFQNYFDSLSLKWELQPFTGRSDYGPFIEVGIPAGGMDTGAEKIKTEDQRKIFGGLANTHFDTCYHQSCDTVANINQEVLIQNAKAAASVLEKLSKIEDLKSYLNS